MEDAEQKMDNFIRFISEEVVPNQSDNAKLKLNELLDKLSRYPLTMTVPYLTVTEDEFVNRVGFKLILNDKQRQKIELYRNYFKELLI